MTPKPRFLSFFYHFSERSDRWAEEKWKNRLIFRKLGTQRDRLWQNPDFSKSVCEQSHVSSSKKFKMRDSILKLWSLEQRRFFATVWNGRKIKGRRVSRHRISAQLLGLRLFSLCVIIISAVFFGGTQWVLLIHINILKNCAVKCLTMIGVYLHIRHARSSRFCLLLFTL